MPLEYDKTNTTLSSFGLFISSPLVFFRYKRAMSLKDFPFVFVQRKYDQMGNRDSFLRTKEYFLLSVNNLDSLSHQIV